MLTDFSMKLAPPPQNLLATGFGWAPKAIE